MRDWLAMGCTGGEDEGGKEWVHELSNQRAKMAMASLKTGSLEELRKEPWRLQIQADNTAEQLRNLVLKNYHVFIQSNQCAAIVKDDLSELKKETVHIEDSLPELQKHCAKFQKDVAAVVAQHGDIQFVFEHYLQIPQLLEACIHNELFDSALDVIQFANETFRADESVDVAPNVVIECLVREVAQMTSTMREKLLQKLREDLQLALCVRIVGFLRRLDVLVGQNSAVVGSVEYEKQLKEEFLACRNVWLSSLSRGVSASDPYQYNIDGKVDPPLCRWATTTVASFIHILMKCVRYKLHASLHLAGLPALTHSCACCRLCTAESRQLPKIDDFSSIATILEQSLFFGGSLGRVGVDFRAVLVVYFEDHVLNLMTETWRAACLEFQEGLSAHALSASGNASYSSSSSKTPIVLASYRSASNGVGNFPFASRSAASTADGEDYSPPRCLMSFPLLAEFTNALLTSLNELRLCTIASLQNRLGRNFQSAIGTMLLTIADFVDENGLALHASDAESNGDSTSMTSRNARAAALTESIRAMNEVIRAELVPYLIKCFHRLFPVPESPARSAAIAVEKEVAGFDEIMREAGLLAASSAVETEAKPVKLSEEESTDALDADEGGNSL
ncbi:hypothetical protein BBJ28_00002555 [Nothophytophthora sp. Chile5]|nr:hypothetical protein BBJ28_00002555 [Nothophytophthora sp. Chile5]